MSRLKLKATLTTVMAASISCATVLPTSFLTLHEDKNELPSLSLIKNDFSSDQSLELNNKPYEYNSSPVPYYSCNVAFDLDSDGFIALENHSLNEIFINGNVANYFLVQFKSNVLISNDFTINDRLTPTDVNKITNKINEDIDFLSELNLSNLYKTAEPDYSKDIFVKQKQDKSGFLVLNSQLTESKINSISALNNPNLKQLFRNVKKVNLSHNDLIFVPDFNNIFNVNKNAFSNQRFLVENINGINELDLQFNKLTHIDDNLYKVMYRKNGFIEKNDEYGLINLNSNNMPYYLISYNFLNSTQGKKNLEICKKFISYYTLENFLIEVFQSLFERDVLDIIVEKLIEELVLRLPDSIPSEVFYLGIKQKDAVNINWQDIALYFDAEMKLLIGNDFQTFDLLPSFFGNDWYDNSTKNPWVREIGEYRGQTSQALRQIIFPNQSYGHPIASKITHLISNSEIMKPSHNIWIRTKADNSDGSLNVLVTAALYVRQEISNKQIISLQNGVEKAIENLINMGIVKYILDGGEITEIIDDIREVAEYITDPIFSIVSFNWMYDVTSNVTTIQGFSIDNTMNTIVISVASVMGFALVGGIVWFYTKKYRNRKLRDKMFGKGDK